MIHVYAMCLIDGFQIDSVLRRNHLGFYGHLRSRGEKFVFTFAFMEQK